MAARLMTSESRATFGVDHVQHGKTVTTIECRGGPATAHTLAHRSVRRQHRKREYIPDARKRERDGEDAVDVNLEEIAGGRIHVEERGSSTSRNKYCPYAVLPHLAAKPRR